MLSNLANGNMKQYVVNNPMYPDGVQLSKEEGRVVVVDSWDILESKKVNCCMSIKSIAILITCNSDKSNNDNIG